MNDKEAPRVCYNCLFSSWDDPDFDLEREHTPPGGKGICMALAVINRLMEISSVEVPVRAVNGKKILKKMNITSQTQCRLEAKGEEGWTHIFVSRNSRKGT